MGNIILRMVPVGYQYNNVLPHSSCKSSSVFLVLLFLLDWSVVICYNVFCCFGLLIAYTSQILCTHDWLMSTTLLRSGQAWGESVVFARSMNTKQFVTPYFKKLYKIVTIQNKRVLANCNIFSTWVKSSYATQKPYHFTMF